MSKNFRSGLVAGFATTAIAAVGVLFIREKNKHDIDRALIVESDMIDITEQVLKYAPDDEACEEQKELFKTINLAFNNAGLDANKMKNVIDECNKYLNIYCS